MSSSAATTYPLLQEILGIKNLPLQPTYTIRDLADIFRVSVRAIQNRVASGQIAARDLPGRAKFLPQDIEAFLSASKKVGQRRGR
jgi:chorismate synthase